MSEPKNKFFWNATGTQALLKLLNDGETRSAYCFPVSNSPAFIDTVFR